LNQSLAQKKPNKASYKYSHVMTLGFQNQILSQCSSRNVNRPMQVMSRLSIINDLPAEEALCHRSCKDLFMKG
jgi:hypothetical protein